jgi:ribosome maturation factor RimP
MKKSKDLERLEEDSAWVTQHYDSLKKYQGKIVAVKNKDIIAVSENLDTLLVELEKKKEKPACLLLEAIPPKNVSFIL